MPGAPAVVHQPPSRRNPLDLQPRKMSAASIARSRGEPDLAHDRPYTRQPLRPADTPRSAAPWRRRVPFLSPQARQSTTPRGMLSLRRCRMGAGPAAKCRGEGVRWAPIRNAPLAERPANAVRCPGHPAQQPTAPRCGREPGATNTICRGGRAACTLRYRAPSIAPQPATSNSASVSQPSSSAGALRCSWPGSLRQTHQACLKVCSFLPVCSCSKPTMTRCRPRMRVTLALSRGGSSQRVSPGEVSPASSASGRTALAALNERSPSRGAARRMSSRRSFSPRSLIRTTRTRILDKHTALPTGARGRAPVSSTRA